MQIKREKAGEREDVAFRKKFSLFAIKVNYENGEATQRQVNWRSENLLCPKSARA